ARPDCPSLLLVAPDRARSWSLGEPASAAGELRGAGHELLGWVAGRTSGSSLAGLERPAAPPRWI
ncbi:MAG TPA: hypothetical protein VLL08_27145, partial [Kineosporiaceae bacterium]|nr:hypothetical protein [Kineosporiaceae bacterium]